MIRVVKNITALKSRESNNCIEEHYRFLPLTTFGTQVKLKCLFAAAIFVRFRPWVGHWLQRRI